MRMVLTVILILALIGTAVTLFTGVFGMLSTKDNPKRANKLMWLRIVMQAIALAAFGAILMMNGH